MDQPEKEEWVHIHIYIYIYTLGRAEPVTYWVEQGWGMGSTTGPKEGVRPGRRGCKSLAGCVTAGRSLSLPDLSPLLYNRPTRAT